MIKNHKYYLQKEYIALSQKRTKVLDAIDEMPLIKLEESFHQGWIIHIYSDDPYFEEALRACTYKFVEYSAKKISLIRKCKGDYSKVLSLYTHRTKDRLVYIHGPKIFHITKEKFDKLSFKAKAHFKNYSIYGERYSICARNSKGLYELDKIGKDIKVKVLKRIVTHIKEISPELQSESLKIERRLRKNKFYWKGCNSYKRYGKPYKDQRRHLKDSLKHLLKNDIEELNQYNKLKL